MSDESRGGGPDVVQHGPLDEKDARYAERIAERSDWPIGDTNPGTGTLRTTDDVGTGGPADVAGARDFGDTSSIRTGQIGVGGVIGTRQGDVGPSTGATGLSQAERGGLDALAGQPSTASPEEGPLDRAPAERAKERVDLSAGGGLNNAAVEAAGLDRTASVAEEGLPGTSDLGAAAGGDVGAGLGATRGTRPQGARGETSGAGGTRGSGAGTGHLEDTAG